MAVSVFTASLTVGLALILMSNVELASAKTVICYVTNWPQYRPGQGRFHISDVDPSKCTMMVFAFAKVVGNRLDNYEENDVGPNGQYMQFTRLKQQYPNTQTLLGVGGWNHGGDPFSSMAATPQGRAEFVRTTIDYLRRYNFDGLDLDWEYPKANDRQNLVSLVQELRQAFDQEYANGRSRLMLLMAVAAGLQNAVPAYDVPALNRYLDYINVMTYDYHGAWENKTGLLAPLNAPPGDDFSLAVSMDWWVRSGASKSKLHVGIALYGRAWQLANPGDSAIGSVTSGKGTVGRFTKEPGVLSHYEVCERLRSGGYTSVLDPLGQINYAFNTNEWMTYEDTVSVDRKVQYILDNDFAGAMVWSFDQDDFKGQFCGRGPYPLISVISNRLINAGPSVGAARPYPQPPQQYPQQPQQYPQQPQQYPQQPQQYPQQPQQYPQQPQQYPQQPQQYPQQPQQYPQQPQQYPQQPQQYPQQPQQYPLQPQQYPQQPQQYPQQPQQYPQQPQQYPQPGAYPYNAPPQYPQPAQIIAPQQPYRPPARANPVLSAEELVQDSAPSSKCPPVPLPPQEPQPAVVAGQAFSCPSSNGKFVHTTSCDYYYFCLFNMPFRERCPKYSLFNPFTLNCECIASTTYVCPLSRAKVSDAGESPDTPTDPADVAGTVNAGTPVIAGTPDNAGPPAVAGTPDNAGPPAVADTSAAAGTGDAAGTSNTAGTAIAGGSDAASAPAAAPVPAEPATP